MRRRKGDVVSYAENNTKGGVRMMGRQNPIKRTDVTTLFVAPAPVLFARPVASSMDVYFAQTVPSIENIIK